MLSLSSTRFKFLVLACFMWAIAFSASAGTWQWMNPRPQGNNLLCACVVPGTGTIYTAGSGGIVLRSEDSGSTWTHIPVNSNGDITKIQFINGSTGFILVGGYEIWRTTNAGQSWSICASNYYTQLRSFSFLNAKTGIIVGNGGLITMTTDSCKQWRSKSTGLIVSTDLYAVQMVDDTTICLTGKGGLFMKTSDTCGKWYTYYGYWDDNTAVGLQFVSPDYGCYWGWTGLKITYDGGKTWNTTSGNIHMVTNAAMYSVDNVYVVGIWLDATLQSDDAPTVGYTSNGSTIKTQYAPDQLNAIVNIGVNTVVAVGQNGLIMKSTNYGNTWTMETPTVTTRNLDNIFFVSPNTGWAVGDSGTILKTTDGGLNWNVTKSPFTSQIAEIYFLNKDTGWLSTTNDAGVYKTTDGGSTWSAVVNLSVQGAVTYGAFSFINDKLGFMAGPGIWRTVNDSSWKPAPWNYGAYISHTYFKNANEGWAGGWAGGYDAFFYTKDQGKSWYPITNGPNTDGFVSMQFIDSSKGWCILYYRGDFEKTTDGGKTWSSAADNLSKGIGLYFVGQDTGIAMSSDGISKLSTDSGKTWNFQYPNIAKTMRKLYYYNGKLWMVGDRGSILSYDFGKNLAPLPVPYAGRDTTVCERDSVYLGKDSIAGHAYMWTSTPAGFHSTLSRPGIKASQTATYHLTETIRISGQYQTADVTITVKPGPAGRAGADQAICLGQNAQIGMDTVAGYSYSWASMPAGFSGSRPKASVSPAISTSYIVHETLLSNGCQLADTVKLTVNPLPASLSATKSVCYGDSISIGSVIASPDSFAWADAAGYVSSSPDPKVQVTANALYYGTEKNKTTGCIRIDTVSITMNPLPASLSAHKYVCYGDSVNIGSSAATTDGFAWSGASGYKSTSQNPKVRVTATTVYYGIEKNNITGCSSYDTVIVNMNPLPASFSSRKDTCQGDSINIGTRAATTDSFKWVTWPGQKFVSSSSNPLVYASSSDNYIAWDKNNTTGCIRYDTVLVVAHVSPNISMLYGRSTCTGQSIRIGEKLGGTYTCRWTEGKGNFVSDSATLSVNPKISTKYYATIIDTSDGCIVHDSVKVTVVPPPYAGWTYKDSGQYYVFVADSAKQGWYIWSFGDGSANDTSQLRYHAHIFPKNKSYTISLKVDGIACATAHDSTLNITASGISPQAMNLPGLDIYPNPFADKISIKIMLPQATRVAVSLTDVHGNTMISQQPQTLQAGASTIELNTTAAHLVPGTYFVNIQAGDKQISQKIMKW